MTHKAFQTITIQDFVRRGGNLDGVLGLTSEMRREVEISELKRAANLYLSDGVAEEVSVLPNVVSPYQRPCAIGKYDWYE